MAPVPGLPSPKAVVGHTRAQNGAMMKRGRGGKGPRPNRNLAAAAAGNPLQQQAQAELDPIIAAIKAGALGQARRSDAAIQGLTAQYANDISGIDYGAPYSSAEAQQAAVDNALRQSATGQGSDLAAALSQRLSALQGSSGANAVSQESGALANQGAGIGGAQLATGSASLDQLIADAAAAKEYGTKMPGVIKSAGIQAVGQAQGMAQQAIDQGRQQIESQLPQIMQTLKADRLQAQSNRQNAAYKQAALASENAYRQASLGLRGQSLRLEGQRLQMDAQKMMDQHKLAWARIGISDKRLQMEIAKQDLSARTGGLSKPEVSRYTALAQSWASRMGSATKNPTTGKAEPSLSFKDAMTQALKSGVPLSIALPIFNREAKAQGATPAQMKQLDRYYGKLDGALQKSAVNWTKFSQSQVGGALGGAVKSAAAKTILSLAHHFIGTPYVWGGESPKGFDCSGFAQYLYGKAGISIPRTTYTQWTAKNGHAVPKGQLRPGDLVFFKGGDSMNGLPGHVGIYIGNGMMIDAPHTGADVRVESVRSFGGYMGARRFGNA